ncbi:MAG: hypothetical protein E6Q88_02990 [Lysobacteraceae bacterium]|nr:MAG: hypothetical protein E6Q88_02990 [Xanthomonadaceae bacterium]
MEPTSGNKGTFRSEALAAQREKYQGEPAMAYPLSLSRLGWGVAIVAVALIAFLAFSDYTQYYRATGIVSPRSGITVHVAGQEGTVYLAPEAVPGTRLRAGALLGWVDAAAAVEAANSVTDAGLSHLASKRDSLQRADRITDASSQAQLASIESQSRLLDTQLSRLQQERALVGERLRLKQAELERNTALQRDGFVSSQAVSVLRGEVAELQSEAANAERDVAALRQQAMALNQRAIDLRDRSRTETERLRQDMAELDSRIASARGNRRVELRAGKALAVEALHVESGNYVDIDTPIVTTVNPAEALQIRALVSASAVVGLRPGTRVRIRYEAFPYYYYGSFEGRVTSVDRSPWRGEAANRTEAERQAREPLYRVMVQPSDQRIQTPQGARQLLSGMVAQVEIPRATRSLLQWILLPGSNY